MYSPQQGRFYSRDPIGIWGDGVNWGNGYGYVGGNAVNGRDPWGLDDQPAYSKDTPGPWHPEGGVKACTAADSCELLAKKIGLFSRTITSHTDWVAKYGKASGDYHIQDIQGLKNGVTNCIAIFLAKCKPPACEPVPSPSPVPVPTQVYKEAAKDSVKAMSIFTILYWVVSEGSRLFPPRNLIPIP